MVIKSRVQQHDYWRRIEDIPYDYSICRSGIFDSGIFVSGAVNCEMFFNVWIMNEYGNEESWTKLFHVPKVHNHQGLRAYKALYIFEDEKLLVEFFYVETCDRKLVVYDSKTATFNILEFQNNYAQMNPKVYIESLMLP
ncbi:hypothetical protein MTR_3g006550 [Medicago truncatula]|uniref:F-box protein interaction domain protein n=1 Tax=Medicago truncatula TaxID=3880 RepID=A0A072USL5_MEDTR|nr:hypothetical protein MTR_3g006550 [Medicago truncatula]